MFLFIQLIFRVLGATVMAIGASIFIFGPHTTATLSSATLSILTSGESYSGSLDDINTDSEMRFYSVFWITYGVALFGYHHI